MAVTGRNTEREWPTSPGLTRYFYPRSSHIVKASKDVLGLKKTKADEEFEKSESAVLHDVPDKFFTGPF